MQDPNSVASKIFCIPPIFEGDMINIEEVVDQLKELHEELRETSDMYSRLTRDQDIDRNLAGFIRFWVDFPVEWDDFPLEEINILDDCEEFDHIVSICEFLDEVSGPCGEPYQSGGIEFPSVLIDESYFPRYIIEYLDSSGICSGLEYVVLNEDATAELFKSDYKSFDLFSRTYYCRA